MLSKRASDGFSEDSQQSENPGVDTTALLAMLNIQPSSLGAPVGHSDRVTVYALAIGRYLDLSQKILQDLKSAAVLHDVGKVGISRAIVDKLGRLTDREFEIMRLHSSIATRMLENVEGLKDSIPMIKYHHERFDGKGYPDGLAGHDIPLGARIIAVAETFDMLTSDMPWRNSMTLDRAIEEINENSGTQFDPMIVEAFTSAIHAKHIELPENSEEQPPRTRKHKMH